MRILHTSDWHVGKTLRGASRIDEQRAVLDEIVGVAREEQVDAVLVTGDLFESAAPPPEAQELAWATLLALRDAGAQVLAIAGNHDHQRGFDALAPVFGAAGVTLVGHARRADEGGVVDVTTRAGERLVCVLIPFVSQRYAVKTEQILALDAAQAAGVYADRMRLIVESLCRPFSPDAVNVIAFHGFVHGGRRGGGEREAQLVDAYCVEPTAFPGSAQYVALGHLHRTQQIPGPAPLWYAGSPVQLDFGEESDDKHVLLVDVEAGKPAVVRERRLERGARLRTVRGTLDELRDLAAGDGLGDAFLRVFVDEPARAGLADEVRELLPRTVDVRVADRPGPGVDPVAAAASERAPRDLFCSYLDERGHERDERLLALFDDLLDQATAAEPV